MKIYKDGRKKDMICRKGFKRWLIKWKGLKRNGVMIRKYLKLSYRNIKIKSGKLMQVLIYWLRN